MTFDEYTVKLDALRTEYSDSIKQIALVLGGVNLIERVQVEADEYRLRVQLLVAEYRSFV